MFLFLTSFFSHASPFVHGFIFSLLPLYYIERSPTLFCVLSALHFHDSLPRLSSRTTFLFSPAGATSFFCLKGILQGRQYIEQLIGPLANFSTFI